MTEISSQSPPVSKIPPLRFYVPPVDRGVKVLCPASHVFLTMFWCYVFPDGNAIGFLVLWWWACPGVGVILRCCCEYFLLVVFIFLWCYWWWCYVTRSVVMFWFIMVLGFYIFLVVLLYSSRCCVGVMFFLGVVFYSSWCCGIISCGGFTFPWGYGITVVSYFSPPRCCHFRGHIISLNH